MFVHDDGDAHATLFHGEVDWEPYRVTDAGGRPDAGDLILNHEEFAFVIARAGRDSVATRRRSGWPVRSVVARQQLLDRALAEIPRRPRSVRSPSTSERE